ncbi:MAG: ECF RNA polymerase sigma factor SigR [bacterium]|nr:ECF RNA polymerase sigma factor SigR [bacterium]
MNDNELIRAIKTGNAAAFQALVEQYKDLVVNTCYGFVHDREDAEDLAQDVFVETYESVHAFREKAKLSTWLYRITVNKCLNQIKKNKRRRWRQSLQTLFGSEDDPPEIVDASVADPQTDLEQQERRNVLNQAIAALAENQQIAFTLSKYENLSYQEIAEVMGTTVSAVESLLNRAKKNLQKKLYDYYRDG